MPRVLGVKLWFLGPAAALVVLALAYRRRVARNVEAFKLRWALPVPQVTGSWRSGWNR